MLGRLLQLVVGVVELGRVDIEDILLESDQLPSGDGALDLLLAQPAGIGEDRQHEFHVLRALMAFGHFLELLLGALDQRVEVLHGLVQGLQLRVGVKVLGALPPDGHVGVLLVGRAVPNLEDVVPPPHGVLHDPPHEGHALKDLLFLVGVHDLLLLRRARASLARLHRPLALVQKQRLVVVDKPDQGLPGIGLRVADDLFDRQPLHPLPAEVQWLRLLHLGDLVGQAQGVGLVIAPSVNEAILRQRVTHVVDRQDLANEHVLKGLDPVGFVGAMEIVREPELAA
mmetsp:Transcript_71132/g.206310  ORF Transcript_71132/g.206310 Transcript_71132/m.206310 type:complete len:284 (-) Transcript_71132:438-1289(-)